MLLEYTWTPPGGERQTVECAVCVDQTVCHLGGRRSWFLCPRCGMRRAILYGVASDGRFGCRACMRLGYSSETEDYIDRVGRKQWKQEAKLDAGVRRPKWMRRRTYEATRRRAFRLMWQRDLIIDERLEQMNLNELTWRRVRGNKTLPAIRGLGSG